MHDNIGLERQRGAAYMTEQGENYEGFFSSRRRVLEGRIKEIDQHVLKLQTERNAALSELERLIRAMQILEETPARVGERPQLTIKQGVLRVLESAPDGLTALGILERLKLDLEMDYERTSLSPQLSRLKRDGKIKLDGGIWSLNKGTA
jgi:hypothetical protein